MRSIILAVVLLTAFAVYPQEKPAIDVKTEVSEKTNFMPIKTGLVYMLYKSDKLSVTEFGEDFSLWLKDYNAGQQGSEVTITFKLELRTPAFMRSGRLLEEREVVVRYTENSIDDLEGEKLNLFEKFKMEAAELKEELTAEAFFGGTAAMKTLEEIIWQHTE